MYIYVLSINFIKLFLVLRQLENQNCEKVREISQNSKIHYNKTIHRLIYNYLTLIPIVLKLSLICFF